jgi:hypothetical protein
LGVGTWSHFHVTDFGRFGGVPWLYWAVKVDSVEEAVEAVSCRVLMSLICLNVIAENTLEDEEFRKYPKFRDRADEVHRMSANGAN